MKKVLAIMLALLLLCSLAACGGGNDSGGNSTPPATSENTPEQPSGSETEGEPTPSESEEPSAPADLGTVEGYLAQIGFTEDDLATDGLTELKLEDYGVGVFTGEKPTNEAVKAWFDAVFDKAKSVSDDGNLYLQASATERKEFIPDEAMQWDQFDGAAIYSGFVFDYKGQEKQMTLSWSTFNDPAFTLGVFDE